MTVHDGSGEGPYQLYLCAVIMVIVGNLRCVRQSTLTWEVPRLLLLSYYCCFCGGSHLL